MIKIKNFNIHEDLNFDTVCKAAALHIVSFVKNKPDAVIGFATGKTPKLLYKNIVIYAQEKKVSFKHVKTFNLDEYIGLPEDSKDSYRYYMHQHIFSHLDFNPFNIHFPNTSIDLEKAIIEYQKALDTHQIDIQILGIGKNGHIGFNEPGTSFEETTHLSILHPMTLKDNESEIKHTDFQPKKALTMGIKDIMKSKLLIVLANGSHKSEPIHRMIHGPITSDFPASILQKHPHVYVYLDKQASEKIAT